MLFRSCGFIACRRFMCTCCWKKHLAHTERVRQFFMCSKKVHSFTEQRHFLAGGMQDAQRNCWQELNGCKSRNDSFSCVAQKCMALQSKDAFCFWAREMLGGIVSRNLMGARPGVSHSGPPPKAWCDMPCCCMCASASCELRRHHCVVVRIRCTALVWCTGTCACASGKCTWDQAHARLKHCLCWLDPETCVCHSTSSDVGLPRWQFHL